MKAEQKYRPKWLGVLMLILALSSLSFAVYFHLIEVDYAKALFQSVISVLTQHTP